MFGFGGPHFFFQSRTTPKSLFFGVSGTGFNTDVDSIFYSSVGVNIKTFCLASCPESMVITSPSYICRYCQDFMSHCTSCLTSTHCITCSSQLYFLATDHTACNLCRYSIQYCEICTNQYTCLSCYIGDLVVGGCSNIIGCIQVGQLAMFGGAVSTCVACDSL
jgi:hypothetical protein